MRKILIATDGSPEAREAVEYGLELAEEEQCRGTLLQVIPPMDWTHLDRGAVESPDSRGARAATRHRPRRGRSPRSRAQRSGDVRGRGWGSGRRDRRLRRQSRCRSDRRRLAWTRSGRERAARQRVAGRPARVAAPGARCPRHDALGRNAGPRLRESRIRSEGSPQRASADPPMKVVQPAAKLQSQRSELEQGLDRDEKEFEMRKVFEIGGIVAAAVLVAFGVAAIVMGVNGRSTVQSKPQARADRRLARHDAGRHQGRGTEGGPPATLALPTVAVAGKRSTPAHGPARSRATCGSTRSSPPAA